MAEIDAFNYEGKWVFGAAGDGQVLPAIIEDLLRKAGKMIAGKETLSSYLGIIVTPGPVIIARFPPPGPETGRDNPNIDPGREV
ncbi:MAG: hypothetical protein UX80_C0006G0046 [Candidatus Amesbacteria bacterium GW2011_GWA2_47_11b]|uniref:Uncharacterized protein n=3 Tax=Candidatus Amesiibacteriota TaxID=1752730 RepID=A0A0G1SI68_9BACT|nr:MAG: hypothetical protein UX42_C0003G0041 [Microgenomates group bacterium GW2011_GWC1_46_20]KKU58076.1 MAG: hypothetical protein UX80_C0006G0046 [Candidatus Amesbacteria bacterium GW2011_GWA2_47_11b]KKU69127.1 MAG: hypothetical protein UX92_C0014G0018 [Candidatus Amesbacteria bacterium GW2011_GWA1_47_20]KKU84023.1 MAG: hypothetical protein UY11_C0007G0002 [Candidatus Amesbacteria bacterium GW2011_GWC2_47_8]